MSTMPFFRGMIYVALIGTTSHLKGAIVSLMPPHSSHLVKFVSQLVARSCDGRPTCVMKGAIAPRLLTQEVLAAIQLSAKPPLAIINHGISGLT